MKNLLLLLFALSLFSCQENMPVIPPPPNPGDAARKVIVEEFTGVQCSGCPSGSAELENLLAIYGDNLVVVSIHTSDFGNPFPESQHDFRTAAGEELVNYLGNPFAYPSAVINRKDFDGGSYRLQYGKDKWNGFINEELVDTPRITVNLTKSFDFTTRELRAQISGVAVEDLTGEVRLTVMVTETGIIDPQLDESAGLILDYKHKHVFRATLTNTKGDPLGTDMAEGDAYDVTKSIIIPDGPEGWIPENCEIIAFVNLVNGQNKEVLQVEATQVQD
ncbi:MAG: Omp28-related outer membrane protein [Bacteroidota bacterium]